LEIKPYKSFNRTLYFKIMKYKSSLFILLTLTGCSQSDSTGTPSELEGTWLSACSNTSFEFFGQTINEYSVTTINFEANNYTLSSISYSDKNCTVTPQVGSSFNTKFIIGPSVTTSNGVSAKQIDFVNSSGDTRLDIYLLQDNNNTLFFGKNTHNGRPSEINYADIYTKQS